MEDVKIDSDIWQVFTWWSCILAIHLMALTWYTGRQRIHYRVIHSEEDKRWFPNNGDRPLTICPSGDGHWYIELLRSAHFDDLAAVALYFVCCPLFMHVAPNDEATAPLEYAIPIFAVAKILDTALQLNISYRNYFTHMALSGVCHGFLVYLIVTCLWHLY